MAEQHEAVAQFQSPVRVGEQIYMVIGDNKTKAQLACLDFIDGQIRWREPIGGSRGNLIAAGGHLLVLSDRGELRLAEASPEGYRELGRMQALGGRCWAPPALAGGRLYCRNNGGSLVCIDLRGGPRARPRIW